MGTIRQENKSLYWAWKAMKQRCLNPKCKAYRNYGARGIRVCEEWLEFEPFIKWAVLNGHRKGLELDRIDNNSDYSPHNCRWVSRKENINNRRRTIRLKVGGIVKARTKWEENLHLPQGILKAWVNTHGEEYAEKRLSEILRDGYKEKNFSYSHCKRVIHVDTGLIFNSVKEAALYFGFAPCTISNAIRNDRPTSKGAFTWEELKG